MFEIVAGELRVKLGAVSAMRQVRSGRDTCAVAAGPGRASSLHAEPHISNLAPLVRRAPEGPVGLAAVPVGGGGAWPGFEATRRAKLAARTARGRAAAHGHNQQPGPTAHHAAPGTPVAPQAATQRKRAAARQGRRAFTQLVHTLDTVESWGHSTQSRGRAFSAVAQPRPRRPGPR